MIQKRRIIRIVVVFFLGIITVSESSSQAIGQQSAKQHGIGFATYFSGHYSSPESDRAVENIADTGAEWVNILVTQYQYDLNSTTIYSTNKTPTDEDLIHVIAQAHALGLKVMLKPHVDIQSNESEWRGRIGQNFNESQWSAWFSTYRNFIGHYAELAENQGVEQFVIGTELVTTSTRDSDWRQVVSHVRARYSGPITYSANHTGEEVNVDWWDAVDYIGVSGYYNLTNKNNPTVAELRSAWQPHLDTLNSLSQQWDRSVIFTEVGYRSSDGNNTHPWCHWCDESLDLQEQVDTYQAFFETVYVQPWFGGVYWWGWDLDPEDNGVCNAGYSPHLKPAENILRSQFGGNSIGIPTSCGGSAATATPTVDAPTATPTPNLPDPTETALPPSATAAPPTATPGPTGATATPISIEPAPDDSCGGLRHEAEAAVTGAGAAGQSAFIIGQDEAASGGKYIEATLGSASGTFDANVNATYCITIVEPGTYGIRARSLSLDSLSNSLYLYIDGKPAEGHTWHLWATGSYVVTDLYTAQGDDPNPVKLEVQLSAGEHQIAFAGREKGSRLDWFELVPSSQPAQAAPSPTPVSTSIPDAACGALQQEAERGELSGLFTAGTDGAANGGAYIHVANGHGSRGTELDAEQKVTLCLRVNTPGTYRLKGWTYGASGFDNSFYVRINGWPSQGLVWHTPINAAYSGEYVTTYNVDTNRFDVLEVVLEPGDQIIEFFLREDGSRLDRIALEQVAGAANAGTGTPEDGPRLEDDILFGDPPTGNLLYLPFLQR